MKFYSFEIADNKIVNNNGEVAEVGTEFNHYDDKTFGVEEIYYKTVNKQVSEIVCSASDEDSAEEAVEEFLSNLE